MVLEIDDKYYFIYNSIHINMYVHKYIFKHQIKREKICTYNKYIFEEDAYNKLKLPYLCAQST